MQDSKPGLRNQKQWPSLAGIVDDKKRKWKGYTYSQFLF